ncbi:MAG: replicative DNA helicase [Clostridiales bacterium]|nr:replicative DNA helicase [Clostridiales bacterium]
MENNQMQQVDRMMPNDIESERSVLGAILLNNECINIVYEKIKNSEYFYRSNNREIYDAMCTLLKADTPIDMVTLSSELIKRGMLENVGGITYLTELTGTVPSVANVEHYVDIVVEKYKLRRLITDLGKSVSECYGAERESKEIIEGAESSLFNISMNNEASKLTHVSESVNDVYEEIRQIYLNHGKTRGVPTGFYEIDQMTGGLQPANLIIIAGRPSMGKTSLAMNMAAHAAMVEKKSVAFFSLEMSRNDLLMRLIGTAAAVDGNKIRSGDLETEDWERIYDATELLNNSKLYIDDTTQIGVTEIRSKCRRIKDLALVVIDYISLMATENKESRQQEVSLLSRQLKSLARTLNVPVIVLSQLNRSVTSGRKNHTPMLSDLRESGAIEQDADLVMLVHRPGYYQDEDEDVDKNLAQIIIAKQRNGSTGTVELTWKPELTQFLSRSYRDE